MSRRIMSTFFVLILGTIILAAMAAPADAQYRCAVAIQLKGKDVLKGEIRDTEPPSTDLLWELLHSLSFSPTDEAKGVPELKWVEKSTLTGELHVSINGAGSMKLKELRLIPNKRNPDAWVIEPSEVTRILQMRKAQSKESPKK